jgi:hypothetical protein
MDTQTWKLWELAPAGRAPLPAGPWRTREGEPLHGVWGRADADGTETVVVANHGRVLVGWQVPHQRWWCASPLMRASTCALAQVPWLWSDAAGLRATDPSDVAVGLVLAGRKPVALADTTDASLARRWQEAARAAGFVARCTSTTFDCVPVPRTVWFVHVAIPGTVAQHVDGDALLADYGACLDAGSFTEVEQALEAVREAEFAELAEDPDLIVAVRPGELARTGLVLGYHPATTAGLILGLASFSWADDPDGLAYDPTVVHAATSAGLPGLPSGLGAGDARRHVHARERGPGYEHATAGTVGHVRRGQGRRAGLALLHLNAFRDGPVTRAWKGFAWDALDRLHAQGYISDPKSKTKSVVLSDEGARRAQVLFEQHFGA